MRYTKICKTILVATISAICFSLCSCSHDMVERPETETVVLDRKDLYGVGESESGIAPDILTLIDDYVTDFNSYAPEDIRLVNYAVTPMNGGYAITGANGVQGLVQVNSSGNILILTPLNGTSTQKIQISLASMNQIMDREYFPADKVALKNAIHNNCAAVSEAFDQAKTNFTGSGLDTSLPDVSDQMEADQQALEELIAKCDAFLEKYFPEEAEADK